MTAIFVLLTNLWEVGPRHLLYTVEILCKLFELFTLTGKLFKVVRRHEKNEIKTNKIKTTTTCVSIVYFSLKLFKLTGFDGLMFQVLIFLLLIYGKSIHVRILLYQK